MHVQQRAFRGEHGVRVVKRARHRVALRKADGDERMRVGGGLADLGEFRAVGQDRCVVVALPIGPAPFGARTHREAERQAVRIARNRQFRHHHELGAVRARLADDRSRLRRARGLVEQHRLDLRDRQFARVLRIPHFAAFLVADFIKAMLRQRYEASRSRAQSIWRLASSSCTAWDR